MRGSWKIATVAGIGVYIHWTFLFLLLWIVYQSGFRGGEFQAAAALSSVLFVAAIFTCIVLHELGHALTARRYGIKTRDITLLPIGGVARLEKMPDVPLQELWVALAGPAVNVVIAVILVGVLFVMNAAAHVLDPAKIEVLLKEGGLSLVSFLVSLLAVNVFMVIFNLLPAFPMDGGRVLRAILAHVTGDYVSATQTAAGVGQAMAILFGILGIFATNPMLLFIALFVYLGAQEEAAMVQMRSIFHGLPVRAAMMTRFRSLGPEEPLSRAIEEMLAGAQHDFPVVHNGRVIGILQRSDLLKALAQGSDMNQKVADVMRSDCGHVEDNDMLESTFTRMRDVGCSSLPVVHGEELVGVITLENVGEFMLVRSAVNSRGKPSGA